MIYTVAALRTSVSAAAGAQCRKLLPDQTTADVIGYAAEYAWAKQNNIFPDLTFTSRKNGYDNITAGKRIDIKASTNFKARLLSSLDQKNPDVDIMILAIVQMPTVHFVGWCTINELRRPEHLLDLGYGPVYALEQGHPLLKPITAPKRKLASVAGSV
ncbi:hypothetical protein UFOVP822_20 [uncultured Caudovirales phage]|uniref:Uncharacterized protein n=1 Tax=uncultured Caudovirales phage TaxID=2100421 RepID=A0A6J5PC77_9CAUD|nr:hypothetical protein UFOVP822_20 [uncultured Caudovirales phage]